MWMSVAVIANCILSFRFGEGFFVPFCPDRRHFPNGFVRYKNLPQEADTFYSQAQLTNGVQRIYRCYWGYVLRGRNTARCANGKWSNKTPKCVPIGCRPIVPQANNYNRHGTRYTTTIQSNNRYQQGTVIQVACKRATSLVDGDGSAMCIAAQWLPTIPLCLTRKAIKSISDPLNKHNSFCSDFRDFPNGFVKYKNLPQGAESFYGQAQLVNGVLKLHRCNWGFVLKGSVNAHCVDGRWSTKKPRCIPSGCIRIQPTVNNYDSFLYSTDLRSDDSYQHGTVVQVYCKRGTTLVDGDGTSTCTSGQWEPSIPLCLTRETLTADADPMNADNICQLPLLWSGVYLNDAPDVVSDGVKVDYECLQRAERVTETPVQCYQGVWYPDSPKCVEKTCLVPDRPPYAIMLNGLGSDDRLDHGLELRYKCEKGYRLGGGNLTLQCKYGVLAGILPVCEQDPSYDFTQCGVAGDTTQRFSGRVIGGFDARDQAWPWQAAIFWERNDGSWFFFCGGTLVEQNWVLSAGHCFGYDEDIVRLQVRLGMTNRDTDSGTYKEQIFNIDGLYLPKQHDFISFDYDIALLHLERPALLNIFVRSVCLPPVPGPGDDVNELIEIDEFGMVLGWGHSSPVPANISRGSNFKDTLQQLEMPLRTDAACINSLIDIGEEPSIFTHHMFCAGFNRKLRDACFGDSGGPFMRKIVPPLEGQTEWRWMEIGIVSSGKGCAVKGQFAFFTHVPKLMRWVDTVMKGNHTPSAHDMYLV